MNPTMGNFIDGGAAVIDVQRLLETRMLIQANSGGGKSWAIRRLLEQTAGQVQQLVIDPEGEFATLREKHDYVIAAAHDGDALAHPKTAQILARRLLETGVSAILDIYDLKAHERQAFVRIFCDALVNAPKSLWHPTLIVLDEAHIFCPEAGKAESAGAVIDLATRGRKRGFSLIAATQRLAKLHKDTAAELLNKLIGRTGLDVDVRRAADELGMTPREAMEKLRGLNSGEFFAFGPALSATVRKLKVGDVKTTHPKAGDRSLRAPPKPTAAIVSVLPKLADLPKEAEIEARTLDELKKELSIARRELTQLKTEKPAPSRDDLQAAERRGFDRGKAEAQQASASQLRLLKPALYKAINIAIAELVETQVQARTPDLPVQKVSAQSTARTVEPRQNRHAQLLMDNGSLPVGESAVLRACIQYPNGLERNQLTTLTGYKRSSRDAYIARLKQRGLVEEKGSKIFATDEGCAAIPNAEPLPTGVELQEFWRERLPEGERKCFEILVKAYPNDIAREDIDEITGYKRSSRDAYLARMASKELCRESSRGRVIASDTLF